MLKNAMKPRLNKGQNFTDKNGRSLIISKVWFKMGGVSSYEVTDLDKPEKGASLVDYNKMHSLIDRKKITLRVK